jgi:hypothetical protein
MRTHSCNANERHQMADIALISCVKSKRNMPCAAKDMYVSPLFAKMMAYAISLKAEYIFILSAKYGLLALDTIIEPYEQTLNKMKISERTTWAKNVLDDLNRHTDLDNDNFIFLAGQRYREGLISNMNNYSVPMEGLSFGKQLQWLEKQSHV